MPRRWTSSSAGNLTDQEVSEKLVLLVQQNPTLYDSQSLYHKDPKAASNGWKHIAEELDIPYLTAAEVRTRWRTLRDTYVKRKRNAVNGRPQTSWRYTNILSFLDPCINGPARCSGNILEDVLERLSEEEGWTDTKENIRITAVEEEEDGTQQPSPAPSDNSFANAGNTNMDTPSPPSAPPTRTFPLYPAPPVVKKRKVGEEALYEPHPYPQDLLRGDHSRAEACYRAEVPTRHAMDAFFESCALMSRDLPRIKQGWLQMQVSTLLYMVENSDDLPPLSHTLSFQPPCPQMQGQATQCNTKESQDSNGEDENRTAE